MGLAMALMLYSKYHAVLFVLFILLSNLSLLRNRYFYMAVALAALLFTPHLLWQVQHGFPTFLFHLKVRSEPFRPAYMDDYILQQIVMIGVGVIFVPFVYRHRDKFEKSLRYIAIGSFLFFFLSTLKGFVHLHWTSITIFPLVLLSGAYYSKLKRTRLLHALITPFIVLVILIRLYLSFQIFPFNKLNADYYHGRELWAEDISNIAGNRPVIFETGPDALREAPLYTFYTGRQGMASESILSERSQYFLWHYEDSIQNQDVVLMKTEEYFESRELDTRMGKKLYYREIDHFSSFKNIKLEWDVNDISCGNDTVRIPVRFINHRAVPCSFQDNHTVYILLENRKGEFIRVEQPLSDFSPVKAGSSKLFIFNLDRSVLEEDSYLAAFGIRDRISYPSINSHFGKIDVPYLESR
jgi:hypothetical protein